MSFLASGVVLSPLIVWIFNYFLSLKSKKFLNKKRVDMKAMRDCVSCCHHEEGNCE